MIKKITTPLDDKTISNLRAGDEVFLSGTVFTARDLAHQRLVALLKSGKKLPLDIKGQVIYYCGPTESRPGKIIGSCGPTTSGRMDPFTAPLLEAGLKAMIGKGRRSEDVRRQIEKNKAVYFVATGGAGALLSRRVTANRVLAFKELGPEAIRKLEVEHFPLIVAIDARGRSLYDQK